MVRLPPVVMSAKSATARTTIAREDAEDHQVKLSAQKLEELNNLNDLRSIRAMAISGNHAR
ncbi:TPA: hypothetical protein JZ408_001869 [Escherichia coli]|nr:hypothetical protein [Escherichia coli]HAY2471153.1 hypothetical protein [Escherichia coli]